MIRFAWVMLNIGLATLFFGTIAIVAALLRVRGRVYFWCTQQWSRGILWASGTRVETHGMEGVDWEEPQVLVSNHISGYDIFAIAAVLPVPFYFVGKKELDRIPFFGLAWRAAGHISVDRSNRASAMQSLSRAAKKIRSDGGTVIIFPEGTRSRSGEMLPFKKGAFALAREARVPIVPVVVAGSDRIQPGGGLRVRPHPVHLFFGEPLPPEAEPPESSDELVVRVRSRMEELQRAARSAASAALSLLAVLLLAACGEEASSIAGELAGGADATHVWVLGEPARAEVDADSFRLEGVGAGLVDLRFSDGDREVARMEIRGIAEGEGVRLRGVWFDDGVAHPSAVEGGGGVLTVNGLRMAAPERVPGEVDATATVLAVSDEGDALIARPADEAVPDLRVVVTPGTRVTTPDGDPGTAEELEFGDSVRVLGASEAGYVVATELVVPRERARRR